MQRSALPGLRRTQLRLRIEDVLVRPVGIGRGIRERRYRRHCGRYQCPDGNRRGCKAILCALRRAINGGGDQGSEVLALKHSRAHSKSIERVFLLTRCWP